MTHNIRINEITVYKNKIDKDKKSIYYKRFYDDNEEFTSQKELSSLNDGTHFIHNMFYKQGGGGEIKIDLPIKLKIIDVYDSTASAIIYQRDKIEYPTASYSKVRTGDRVVFMTTY